MTRRILLSILTLVVICCVGMGLLTTTGAVVMASSQQGGACSPHGLLHCRLYSPSRPLPSTKTCRPAVVRQMNNIQDQVIQIRGLQPDKTLDRALLTTSQLQQRVNDDFFKDYTASQAADDVLELSMLGLVEPGFDLYDLIHQALHRASCRLLRQQNQRNVCRSGGKFSGDGANELFT